MTWLLMAACAPSAPPAARPELAERNPHELTVDCRGGAAYASLVDAVAEARSGDRISVAPCTYYGTVNLDGKSLRIVSTDGPAVTTIAATPGKAALFAHDGESSRTVVSGFTLTGGGGPGVPGGVDVEMASLRLEHAVVTGTNGSHAVHGRSADLVLADVRIEGNTSTDGSTIDAQRGYLLLVDSQVTCGAEPYGVQIDHGAFLIDRTTVTCPGADAVYNQHSAGRMQRTNLVGRLFWEGEDAGDEMIVETSVLDGGMLDLNGTLFLRNALVRGGTLELRPGGSGSVLENTVFREIGGCAIQGATTFMTVRNNAFTQVGSGFCGPNVADAGNLVADCAHVDPPGGDWRLTPGSPCIDAGAAATDRDPDGSIADLGVHGGPMTQSGGW